MKHLSIAAALGTMSQSRKMSLIEQLASVAIGFLVALIIQLTLLPVMGIHTTSGQDFLIVSVFTVASIIRGFYVRRFFNWLHNRQAQREWEEWLRQPSNFKTVKIGYRKNG